MPLTSGTTQMLRVHPLGQEIGAVYFVPTFPILLPTPTERTVLAEYLVGNPPERSPVMTDHSNETDSLTTFTFI